MEQLPAPDDQTIRRHLRDRHAFSHRNTYAEAIADLHAAHERRHADRADRVGHRHYVIESVTLPVAQYVALTAAAATAVDHELIGQRDRARNVAVHFEQEVARLEAELSDLADTRVESPPVPVLPAGRYVLRCPVCGDDTIREVERVESTVDVSGTITYDGAGKWTDEDLVYGDPEYGDFTGAEWYECSSWWREDHLTADKGVRWQMEHVLVPAPEVDEPLP